jgi:hypothetical protein
LRYVGGSELPKLFPRSAKVLSTIVRRLRRMPMNLGLLVVVLPIADRSAGPVICSRSSIRRLIE